MTLKTSASFPTVSALAGLAAILLLCPVFWFSNLDLSVAQWAYQAAEPHWPGQSTQPWALLYHYGELLAGITGLLGLLAFLISFYDPKRRNWRGPGLYLFLLLLIGPGLLVNVLLKGLVGRPRPSEISPFGGAWNFIRPFKLGVPGRGLSFPSGHASSAFYFFGFFFILKGQKRWWALLATFAFGCLMGLARILQGGHFLSDILFCGAMLFTLAACLSPLIHWQPSPTVLKRPAFIAAFFGVGVGVLLVGHVLYEERHYIFCTEKFHVSANSTERYFEQIGPVKAVDVKLDLTSGDISLSFDAEGHCPLNLDEFYQAEALPGSKIHLDVAPLQNSPTWKIGSKDLAYSFTQRLRGLAWDRRAHYRLRVNPELACEARLKTSSGAIIINSLPKNRAVLIYSEPELKPASLPAGFQPYGARGYFRQGEQPLIVLNLNAASLHFE